MTCQSTDVKGMTLSKNYTISWNTFSATYPVQTTLAVITSPTPGNTETAILACNVTSNTGSGSYVYTWSVSGYANYTLVQNGNQATITLSSISPGITPVTSISCTTVDSNQTTYTSSFPSFTWASNTSGILGNCVGWYDASDATTYNVNSFTYWNDKSGAGNHLTTITAPTFSTLNGLSFMNFSGNACFFNTSMTWGPPFTIIAVVQALTSGYLISNDSLNGGFIQLYSGVSNNGTPLNNFDTTSNGRPPAPTYGNSPTFVATQWYKKELTYDGTLITPYVNGVAQNSVPTPYRSAFVGIMIGAAGNPTSIYSFWNGYVAEILVYNAVLSTSQRTSVETYLYNKWGI